jgi:zinc protease
MAGSQLPNGLKLYLVEDHELPMVQGLVSIQAGSAFDSADRPGLARLTLDVIRGGGTRGKRAGEWDDALDRLGARLDVVFSETSCGLSFSAPRESAGEVLQAIAAMLAEPAFRLEKLEVAKALKRSALMRREEDSDEAAMRHFLSAVYGSDSAYGRQESETSVGRIERSDVTRFYGRYYVPSNTVLAIQGDFEPAALRADVEKLFGGWTAAQNGAAEAPKAGAAPVAAYAVPAKNLLRAHFVVGQAGGQWRDRDSAAWEVLAMALGGMRRSRIIEHARSPVPGDMVQVIAEWIPKFDHAGIFKISGTCAAPALSTLLEQIQSEVRRLAGSPLTEEETRLAKDAVLAKLAGATDTKIERLGAAVASERAGLSGDFMSRHQAAIAAVSRADLDRLARTLDPAHLTIVAIGDAEDIQRQLKASGRTVTILERAQAPKEKTELATPDAQAVERGRRLMARAQQASGGAEQVAALKDATRTATFAFGPLAGGGRQVRTESWLLPSHFREETGGTRYQVYTNGTGGFVSDGIVSNPLSGALSEQVHAELFKFYPRLLLGDAVPGRTMFAVDGDAVEFREGTRSERLVFDEAGLPSEILFEIKSNNGQPIAVEEVLEDFRAVGGVRMPFRVRVLYNGQHAAMVTVQELKVNSGLSIEDMTRRR